MSLTPLTSEQLAAAHAWLRALESRTRERGAKLVRDRRVLGIESYKRGVGVRAEVLGTYPYKVKLRFDGERWAGDCSCPVMLDCKHAAATMLAALADGTAPVVEPRAEAPTAGTFTAQIAARLGRELSREELRSARAVDRLYKDHRHMRVVPRSSVDAIAPTGGKPGWAWETVEAWPELPSSPWEAWLYVAAYFRRRNAPLPAGWAEATGWAEVDELVGGWERREKISEWNKWLAKTSGQVAAPRDRRHELRVRLDERGAHLEWRKDATAEFKPMALSPFQQITADANNGRLPFDDASLTVWHAFHTGYGAVPFRRYDEPDCARILNTLLRRPDASAHVVGPAAQPLTRSDETLAWRVEANEAARVDYRLALTRPDGAPLPLPLVVIDGEPSLYVTRDTIFPGPPLGGLALRAEGLAIPAEALETPDGVALLDRLAVEPPARLAGRVRTIRLRPVFRCALVPNTFGGGEHLVVEAFAESEAGVSDEVYRVDGWTARQPPEKTTPDVIVRCDRRALAPVPELLESLRMQWWAHGQHWHRQVKKTLPDQFAAWMNALPSDVTLVLDPALASLREPAIAARVKLEVEESDIDWFDLRVALDVADTTLTKEELKLLLDARGGFVRLGEKGWRRLAFQLSEEDEAQLADLGLSARDFSSEPQRMHALQLAGKSAARNLLGERHIAAVERRVAELQTRVAPPVPAGLLAELRPYQVAGFHFLAYLTANRFGGILADDMGLGKTVQALAWLLELRAVPASHPCLVVCPKSVVDNWTVEAARFAPALRVHALPRGADAAALEAARAEADLIILNYAQMRALDKQLTAAPWHVVILDEAQYIKNPESQTARTACTLKAAHRLALSGTPIENRLLDLWSIMAFVMPGVLGRRADFSKHFDQRSDPLARRRLAARVRPFVLRRTKGEVAKDLPERIEEDLHCELDGPQAALYRAELKRARAALLKINTAKQLDGARFNILTSLLRLRQICCHPALVSTKAADAESTKLNALLDLLEPLIEEGHKVLVFSQFVEMLALIRAEIVKREWPHFILTGSTEDRGPLVASFQAAEGAAVFLISLRAGGFGLNLTAASYVVLFDPWWNPAVENQAIDRTHRIGQRNTVIAYRLLVKDTIEEKIRHLQKQKSALAADILGEENFARALTLEDFRFLLSE